MLEAIAAIFGVSVAYLLCAFVAADIDATAWTADGRFFCAMLMVLGGFCGFLSVRIWRLR